MTALSIIGLMILGGVITIASLAVACWLAIRDKLLPKNSNLISCRKCEKRFDVNGAENWIFCAQCLTWYCGDHRNHENHGT